MKTGSLFLMFLLAMSVSVQARDKFIITPSDVPLYGDMDVFIIDKVLFTKAVVPGTRVAPVL